MKKPSVSFVIPTWNRHRELDRLLSSIFMQDRTDYETIVVDNGSTDGTSQWLETLGHRVVRITNPWNRGAAHAKNQGVSVAVARWIWFLDSDSELQDAGVVGRALRIVQESAQIGAIGGEMVPDGVGGLQCRIKRHLPTGETENVLRAGEVRLEPCDYVPTCNCLVRRDLVVAWGGFDPSYFIFGEDDELGVAVRGLGFPCFFDSRLTVAHRFAPTSRRPGLWLSNRNRLRLAVLNFPAPRVALLPLLEIREALRIDNLRVLAGIADSSLLARYLPGTGCRSGVLQRVTSPLVFGLRYGATLAAAYVYTAITLPRLLALRRRRPDYLERLSAEGVPT